MRTITFTIVSIYESLWGFRNRARCFTCLLNLAELFLFSLYRWVNGVWSYSLSDSVVNDFSILLKAERNLRYYLIWRFSNWVPRSFRLSRDTSGTLAVCGKRANVWEARQSGLDFTRWIQMDKHYFHLFYRVTLYFV